MLTRYDESIQYSRRVGNLYTGSLYLGLISLLENSSALQAGDRVGLFSYGSGAVSEFFTGILEENYQDFLDKEDHQALFDNRQQVSVVEYEQIFSETLPEHGQHAAYNSDVPFSIYKVENDIRYYKEAE